MEKNENMSSAEKFAKAKGFVMGINRIPEFPVEALAAFYSDSNGGEIVILPPSVKQAWFRAVYPKGHCTDEAFGSCDENAANVKVTVYATGDTSEELSHAYAVRVFDPNIDGWMRSPAERKTRLYSAAVGLAKSKALTEAGIGMGYYTSRTEFDEIAFESLNPCPEDNGDKVLRKADSSSETERVTLVEDHIQGAANEPEGKKKNAAAVAEEKLEQFRSLVTEISESWDGYRNCEGITRKVLEKKIFGLRDRYEKALEDLEKRAEKGAQNEGNGISRVLTHEIIAAEVSRMPGELLKGKDPFDADEENLSAENSKNNHSKQVSSEQGKDPALTEKETGELETGIAEAGCGKDQDPGTYVIEHLGKSLNELNDRMVCWVALSTKKEISKKDKEMAERYYRMIATDEQYELFERKLAAARVF